MLTYEELHPILVHIARKFANYKYDIDELINEVWIIGAVQKLPDIRLAYKRIRYDIITYIRTQEGRKSQTHSRKSSYKYRTKITSYNAEVDLHKGGTIPDEHSTYEMFMCGEDDDYAEVDFKNELELLLKHTCISCEEMLIIKMKLGGYTLKEIGKVVGVVESRISQINTNVGKRLLANITSIGIGYNKKVIKELCMKGQEK